MKRRQEGNIEVVLRWEVVKSYDHTHFEGKRHTEEEEVVVIVTASELVRTVFIVIVTKLIRE